MRVFYVVYISDETLRKCIDGIRLLSNPFEKESAHITLRGPYRQRYNVDHLSSIVRGTTVLISGVGSFFEAKQNTVFFSCESSHLRAVWHKPNYPDYNPHITLYDGESRRFANELAKAIGKYKYDLCFRA